MNQFDDCDKQLWIETRLTDSFISIHLLSFKDFCNINASAIVHRFTYFEQNSFMKFLQPINVARPAKLLPIYKYKTVYLFLLISVLADPLELTKC
jgi:hypothetical protein